MATTLERSQRAYKRYASFMKPFNERKKSKLTSKAAPFAQMERGLEWVFYVLQHWLERKVEQTMTRLAARLKRPN